LAARQTTILEELSAAARGVLALLVGDRKAPDYFDFSQRGLVGSFIALLAAQFIGAFAPVLFGIDLPPGAITRALIAVALVFVAQMGFAAIVLRQLGRMDGLTPYLVAYNWMNLFLTLVAGVLGGLGLGGIGLIIILGIVVLVMLINIARLVVTLSPLQIAMFLIAQLIGVSIAQILVGVMFPDVADAMASSA
jgi:hypothetical protein